MAEFYSYQDTVPTLRKIYETAYGPGLSVDDVYHHHFEMLAANFPTGSTMIFYLWEDGWRLKNKPYYRVYPKMVEAMCRLNIDRVLSDEIAPPVGLDRLLVELPKGNKLMDNGADVQFMLIDWLSVKTSESVGKPIGVPRAIALTSPEQEAIRSQLAIGIHYGEMDVDAFGTLPLWDIWRFPLKHVTVGEQISSSERDPTPACVDTRSLHVNTVTERRRLTSLALTLMMLENDPEIVLPDVLAADRHKANKGNRDKLADKARRRGRNGWTIGEEIECSPHTRVPHMATFHVGEGRRRMIVKRRKGSIVHREKVVKTPTGYKGDESGEIADK